VTTRQQPAKTPRSHFIRPRTQRINYVNQVFDMGKQPGVGALVADLFEQFQGPSLDAAFADFYK